ncbi:hypothetical protein C0Q70_11796 [Pomacea canaliculata]|uniref:G-protein coupled receptors family 1 profile domain-containing protein n=1 Tax=Pomacea canaliculata TaxID=400727 RepID=A0A2T7P717_POMCA|nr:hypothetical protein C0Q70_11796 [Pomacea canaliculata]
MEPVSREEYENITTSTNSMLDNVDSQVVVTFVVIAVGIIVLAVLGNVLEIIVVCRTTRIETVILQTYLQEEVERAVHSLRGGKSPGIDKVPAVLLNRVWEETTKALTVLCQRVCERKELPKVSAFSLCLIILDIYFDIVHQKWYRNWLNTPKVVLALCTVWGIPLAVNTWPLTPSKGSQLFDMENNQCSIQASPWLVYSSATFYFLLPGKNKSLHITLR